MARKRFNITLPTGESIWITGNTTSEAFANALQRYAFPVAPPPLPKVAAPTLKRFIEEKYRPTFFKNLKPKTVDSYEQYLKLNILPYLGAMRMDEITVTTIQDFYNWMASGSQHGRKNDLNEATIKRVEGLLSKIFRVAVDMEIISSSPIKKTLLQNPGKPAEHHHPISPNEMHHIKTVIPTLEKERERLYMALLAYTGMRPEEILGLRWENIHTEELNNSYCQVACTVTYTGTAKTTTISNSGKTKTSLRTVPLPIPAVQVLETASCKEGYVLGGKEPLTYSTFKRTYTHAFEVLGIKGKYSNYDFRTTYGTELCEAGLTTKQVGDLMGHADTRMVETVYANRRHEGNMSQLDFLNARNAAYAT